jgi:hypothetical protein
MKITEADVVWTRATEDVPEAGNVRVERHGSGWKRTRGDSWVLAARAFDFYQGPKDDPTTQLLSLFVLFNTLVIRDGIDPARAHEAFLAIDEYRRTISPDAPRAEQ